jgi:Na+-translocating ferredoxin:NAD+ oxidoreductase RnfD subunit
MENLVVSTSPHFTLKSSSTRKIMLWVLIALAPTVIAATIFFGYHVLINVLVCALACFFTEYLY